MCEMPGTHGLREALRLFRYVPRSPVYQLWSRDRQDDCGESETVTSGGSVQGREPYENDERVGGLSMNEERRVMIGEKEERQEEVLTVRPADSSRSVSASELRDLYRKVNGTLLQLRGLMERIGIHV